MTNLDIDRRLALAIGYRPEDVRANGFSVEVRRSYTFAGEQWTDWFVFNYREEITIYPIAEHFKMFPQWSEWTLIWLVRSHGGRIWTYHDDPRTCIALAIIEAADRGLL
jgi:hypothetical protein